ncbi:hypothetical protein F3Y22_tig00112206pilonHSYRG00088 [Hibiscus syriacus]|uniref:Uncharacterized protein n=1 Tax=Hibiscus syriacus TaxID=106335 RepID=A0A6A2X4H3_HIBSY|nr:hypothetical protein F3Y22_tig00112206pilonHSYRG00088 [Hibiscus syriacus]
MPYVEARDDARLSDFMASAEIELLNWLLTCQCFCSVPTSTSPQVAIQVTVFGFGGIAIALCDSHKLVEATTASAFIKTWAAFKRGFDSELRNLDMLDAALRLFSPCMFNHLTMNIK